jgi:Holliday junction resolvase
MDPISCVALATGSFKAIKAAIGAGKDLQEMSGQLAQWGKAFSDFTQLEEREKNPPFWKKTFRGSDEESAILIWNNKRKFEEMRQTIKDEISFVYGPSAWKEVLAIEAQMRKQRKDELYRKQEQVDAAINFAIGALIFVLSGGILFVAFYFLGKWQGRW